MIAVIDYEAGNLTSVETALRYLNAPYRVTSDPQFVMSADRVIFPGVGTACQAMDVLSSGGLDEALKAFTATGRPLLGICLGCQILMEFSEEGNRGLLGLIPGSVRLFPGGEVKVPQIGWNAIRHDGSSLFKSIEQQSSFYFVHSYYVSPTLSDGSRSPWVCASSDHDIEFAAAIHRENIWGTQFHPEKSGPKGLLLLENFIKG